MKNAITLIKDLRLQAQVFTWRRGAAWPVAFGLLLIAGGALLAERLLLQPRLLLHTKTLAQLHTSRDGMSQTKDAATQPTTDPFRSTKASLQAVMVPREALPAVIRAIHETALRHRIEVQSSDYQLKQQGRDGWLQQTITLPMRVRYDQFKPFLFDVLRANPSIAVDQISVKREAVAQATPEIIVRLSIWVHGQAGEPEGARP